MFQLVRKHASYANVGASLALFVALGGTSYAALKLPRDSVGSKQIRKSAVDTAELHYRSITAAKLGSDSLQPRHVTQRLRRHIAHVARDASPPLDPLYRAAVADNGDLARGNAIRVEHTPSTNTYRVTFADSVFYDQGRCVPVATLALNGDSDPGHIGTALTSA